MRKDYLYPLEVALYNKIKFFTEKCEMACCILSNEKLGELLGGRNKSSISRTISKLVNLGFLEITQKEPRIIISTNKPMPFTFNCNISDDKTVISNDKTAINDDKTVIDNDKVAHLMALLDDKTVIDAMTKLLSTDDKTVNHNNIYNNIIYNIYNLNKILSKSKSQTEDYTKEFEEWYLAYPKHTSKKEAFKIYSKVIKSILPSKLIDSAIKYKNHCLLNKTDVKFIKHPTTWLNQGCWDDEYETNNKPQMSDKTKEFFDKYKKGE